MTAAPSSPNPTAHRAAPRRNILRRNQGLWTVVCLVLGGLLAWMWVENHDGAAARAEKVFFIRIATFNTSLYRAEAGALLRDLEGGGDEQARKVAETLQRVRPDVVVLNEFDFDVDGAALRVFADEYLAVGQNGAEPLQYAYPFVAPVNTGVDSGLDLDGNGVLGEPADAYGYGTHPGQWGMALLSRYPIRSEQIRTFQKFLWRDMPGNRMPDAREPGGFYSEDAAAALRLSSKSHWDVPIEVGRDARVVHLLVCHPTPPVFDGPEDRNGRRNADEIRLWADYIDPERGAYLVDDAGRRGGLEANASFVICGDLNADPYDGDGLEGAMAQLLEHPRVSDAPAPRSEGGLAAKREQWGANSQHEGDPMHDTGDFRDDGGGPGNLRLDYVLPSADFEVLDSGVFWPLPGQPGAALLDASDHRCVWVDIRV